LIGADVIAGDVIGIILDAVIAVAVVRMEIEMRESRDGGQRQIADVPVQLVRQQVGVGVEVAEIGIDGGKGCGAMRAAYCG